MKVIDRAILCWSHSKVIVIVLSAKYLRLHIYTVFQKIM